MHQQIMTLGWLRNVAQEVPRCGELQLPSPHSMNLRYSPEAGPLHLDAFPNPTKYQIGYVFESKEEATYIIKVCDMLGKELIAETRVSSNGLHGDEISLPGLPSGLYMLVVQQGPMVGKFKFNISE